MVIFNVSGQVSCYLPCFLCQESELFAFDPIRRTPKSWHCCSCSWKYSSLDLRRKTFICVFVVFVHHHMPTLLRVRMDHPFLSGQQKMKNFIKSSCDSLYLHKIYTFRRKRYFSSVTRFKKKSNSGMYSIILFLVIYFFKRKPGDCAGYLFPYNKAPAKWWLKTIMIAHLYLSSSWG